MKPFLKGKTQNGIAIFVIQKEKAKERVEKNSLNK